MNGRWDGDERGEGIADAQAFAGGVELLLEATRRPNWVAEQPELHLLPHLRRSCEALPFQLVESHASEDGSFDVELRWLGEKARIADAKAAVFALVGGFAELSTFVRQRSSEPKDDGDALVFEIVTGFLAGQSTFTPHGHTLRVRVTGI